MKSICKLSKAELAAALPELCRTDELKFVCKKCGRLAAKKARLCKALPIAKIVDVDQSTASGEE